jgi:LacI family transcriptional regulator
MARPTVNDIAREAGVSLATVDRVLNARPGVKLRTVTAVQEAITRLGYVRDIAAANLARQRQYRLVAALPDSDSQFVETLATALHDAAQTAAVARTELQILRYPAEDPHRLAALLHALPPTETEGVALMAPETPVLRDAIKALREKGIPVIAIGSDLPNTHRDHFVGIDSRAAGRTAGVLMGRFVGRGPGQILVLAQSMQLRDAIERRHGFDSVMQAEFPELEVLPTLESHGSDATLRAVVTERLRHAPVLRGIYVLGSGHRALAATLADLGLTGRFTIIGHELTPHTRRALQGGQIDAVITQNLGHLARSALRVLRAKADRSPIDAAQEQLRIEILIRENLTDQ